MEEEWTRDNIMYTVITWNEHEPNGKWNLTKENVEESHQIGRENTTQHNAYITFSRVSLLFIAFVVNMTLNTTTKHTTLI